MSAASASPSQFENAATIASGIRVPAAVGDFMILDAVRESGGVALATPEDGHPQVDGNWRRRARAFRFVRRPRFASARWKCCSRAARFEPDERIVIFNTGAAQKYPEAVAEKLPRIDITKPIDWDSI